MSRAWDVAEPELTMTKVEKVEAEVPSYSNGYGFDGLRDNVQDERRFPHRAHMGDPRRAYRRLAQCQRAGLSPRYLLKELTYWMKWKLRAEQRRLKFENGLTKLSG